MAMFLLPQKDPLLAGEKDSESSRELRVGQEPEKGFLRGDLGTASFLAVPAKPTQASTRAPTNALAHSSVFPDLAQCLAPTMYAINICCTKE